MLSLLLQPVLCDEHPEILHELFKLTRTIILLIQ